MLGNSNAHAPEIAWQIFFWGSLLVLFFTYFGYPVVLFFIAPFRKRPVIRSEPHEPTLTILIPARNEARHIESKIRNACELDYPAHKMEILIVDDASDDDTFARGIATIESIVRGEATLRQANPEIARRIRFIRLDESHGKANALNRAAREATGEILVFSDADSLISVHSLRRLVQPFSNPIVGCVAGRYFAGGVHGRNAAGVGFYWRYENYLRRKESQVGGLLGASGALYAVRRETFDDLPSGLINDDFVIPMLIGSKGYRTLYEPSATAMEDESRNAQIEFGRRVRIMAGNCQHLWLFRGLFLSPKRWRMAIQMFCHKLLRVLSPLWLLLAFASNVALIGHSFYSVLFLIQAILYGLAGVGAFLNGRLGKSRLLTLPYYFTMVNVAALGGMYYFLFDRKGLAWNARSQVSGNEPGDSESDSPGEVSSKSAHTAGNSRLS